MSNEKRAASLRRDYIKDGRFYGTESGFDKDLTDLLDTVEREAIEARIEAEKALEEAHGTKNEKRAEAWLNQGPHTRDEWNADLTALLDAVQREAVEEDRVLEREKWLAAHPDGGPYIRYDTYAKDVQEAREAVLEEARGIDAVLQTIHGYATLVQSHGCRPERIEAILQAVDVAREAIRALKGGSHD